MDKMEYTITGSNFCAVIYEAVEKLFTDFLFGLEAELDKHYAEPGTVISWFLERRSKKIINILNGKWTVGDKHDLCLKFERAAHRLLDNAYARDMLAADNPDILVDVFCHYFHNTTAEYCSDWWEEARKVVCRRRDEGKDLFREVFDCNLMIAEDDINCQLKDIEQEKLYFEESFECDYRDPTYEVYSEKRKKEYQNLLDKESKLRARQLELIKELDFIGLC